jgi:hypothetical protein
VAQLGEEEEQEKKKMKKNNEDDMEVHHCPLHCNYYYY